MFGFGTTSTKRRIAIIEQWDLTQVKQRMHNKEVIPMDRLDELEQEYKHYLILCLETPNTCFALSEPVDEFLHNHMLFTDDFSALEKAIKHRFRHQPTITQVEADALADDYNSRTRQGLLLRFGGFSEQCWPISNSICFGKLCAV